MRAARWARYHEAGLPPPPGLLKLRRRPLPWEGLVKIVAALLAGLATLAAGAGAGASLGLVTMYAWFLVSGCVDLATFWLGYALLPEGLQSLVLAASFLSAALPRPAHPALAALAAAAALVCLLETVVEHRLIKFCRAYCTLLLASWLLQLAR